MKPFEFKAKTRFPILTRERLLPLCFRTKRLTREEAAMHFAISIPQAVADGTFEPATLRAYLSRAESSAFTVPGRKKPC